MAAVRRLRGRETHQPGELSYAQYSLLFGLASRAELSSGELAAPPSSRPPRSPRCSTAWSRRPRPARPLRAGQARRHDVAHRARQRARRAPARAFEPRWRAALAEFTDEELLTAAAVLDRLRALFVDDAERPRSPRHQVRDHGR